VRATVGVRDESVDIDAARDGGRQHPFDFPLIEPEDDHPDTAPGHR